MVPVPVIVLLAVVGLFAYVSIGAAVSAAHLRAFGHRYVLDVGWEYKTPSGTWAKEDMFSFAVGVATWPILAAGWAVFGVLLWPGRATRWLAVKVGVYTASVGGYVGQVGEK